MLRRDAIAKRGIGLCYANSARL